MTTITISRQYASGGEEIAARAAQLLGYSIFDKTMMAEVAIEVGLTEQELVDFSEQDLRSVGFLNRLLGGSVTVAQIHTWQEDVSGVRKLAVTHVSDQQAISMVRGVIHAAHRRGNVVVVGRGGQAVLSGLPDVLHVRIEAPLEHRIQRLIDRHGYSPAEAELEINDHDRAARDYLKRYYDIDPSSLLNYHLVINTGQLDLETAAGLVSLAAQQMKPVAQPEFEMPTVMPFFYP